MRCCLSLPDGVTGNTPDSGSGKLRFDSLSGSFIWGHRTVVSSGGSQSPDRGSIPLGPICFFSPPDPDIPDRLFYKGPVLLWFHQQCHLIGSDRKA